MDKIKKFYAPLLSLFMVMLLLFFLFSDLLFKTKIDERFLINWLVGFMVMVYTYLIYAQTGINLGRNKDKYTTSKGGYNASVKNISLAKIDTQIVKFCEGKTLENYKNKRVFLMQRAGYLFLGGKTFENIKREELTKKQLKVFNKINKGLKVTQVYPSQLLSNSETATVCDAGNYAFKIRRKGMFLKIISNLITTGVLAFLVFEDGGITISKITQFLFYIFTMGLTIFSSINTNYNSIVVHEVDAYNRKTAINEEFIVWANDKEKEKVLCLPPPLEENKA